MKAVLKASARRSLAQRGPSNCNRATASGSGMFSKSVELEPKVVRRQTGNAIATTLCEVTVQKVMARQSRLIGWSYFRFEWCSSRSPADQDFSGLQHSQARLTMGDATDRQRSLPLR
jgi:hypothetical protein